MNKILIRVDAFEKVGYGHLKRCLILAESLRDKGEVPIFLVAGDDCAIKQVQDKGFDCMRISCAASFNEQAASIANDIPKTIRCVVSDIAHGVALNKPDGLELYLRVLGNQFEHVIIDAFGVQSLRQNLNAITGRMIVSPYAGEDTEDRDVPYKVLLGPQYFMFDAAYSSVGVKEIKLHAHRVLVTCGGSDPTGVTRKVLASLALCPKRTLEVRVIVSSGFSSVYRDEIHKDALRLPHDVKVIENLSHLANEMMWCDIAISTSGLTKYELAVTGTPAILLSIDASHYDVNQAFSEIGSAMDLGVADDVSEKRLMESMLVLLDNQKLRRRQSENGRKLVDGLGTKRVTESIFSLLQ